LDGVDIDALYVRRPTSEVGALKYIAPGKMRGREFGREGERIARVELSRLDLVAD
jgi:hypothetical protein